MSALDIQLLPAAAGDDEALMQRLATLVNEVYAASEEGLWLHGADRTNAGEFAAFVRAGQIAVARVGGDVVGCVRVEQIDSDTGELGMLAAAPSHRGIGVGRELVRFAEETARKAGLGLMQLKVLVPRNWAHPSKVFLVEWYTRAGYGFVQTGNMEESYPELAALLATPCDFVVHHKALQG